MAARLIAAWLVVAVVLTGPLPLASAQQAPPPPAGPPPAPPASAPAPPQSMQPAPLPPPAEAIRYEEHPRRTDGYDIGAGVITVVKAPFNVALCALGGVVGAALFAVTLGSGYRATTRIVEEGCGGPWVVRGDDIRPDTHPNRVDRAWSSYGGGD